MYLPLDYDAEALLRKIERLSEFISRCFEESSRKDRLIKFVHDSIETGIWYPCLHDLDNWSDWERFAALELLVAAVGLDLEDVMPSFPLPSFKQLKYRFHRSKIQLRQPKTRILLCN